MGRKGKGENGKRIHGRLTEEDSVKCKARRRCGVDRIERAGIFRPFAGFSRKRVEGGGLFLAVLLLFLIAFPPSTSAVESITLAWDQNWESNIAGYKIYYRTGSSGSRVPSRYKGAGIENGDSPIVVHVYEDNNPDPRFVETTLHGLDENLDYYFIVSAYNVQGLESAPSNEAALLRGVAIDDSPTPSASAGGGGGGGCFISSLKR